MKMVIAASVLALSCGVAQAATCTQVSGSKGKQSVTYTLMQGGNDAVKAVGCYSGNDTPIIDSSFALGGVSNWMLADKTDDKKPYLDGGFESFSKAPDFIWSVLNPLGYAHVMVTLKQSSSFAAFVLDSSSALTGTWFTQGPAESAGKLSRASVYFSNDPAPVPLPAGAALLPAGLAALAFLRRRKTR